jgi:uncharacterized protein (DUF433 family)
LAAVHELRNERKKKQCGFGIEHLSRSTCQSGSRAGLPPTTLFAERNLPAVLPVRRPRSRCGLRDNQDVAKAITRDPETMHGIPVFRGTRVAVQTLFDYLEGGDTLEDFLEGFPTVSRALALEALEEAKELLLASS